MSLCESFPRKASPLRGPGSGGRLLVPAEASGSPGRTGGPGGRLWSQGPGGPRSLPSLLGRLSSPFLERLGVGHRISLDGVSVLLGCGRLFSISLSLSRAREIYFNLFLRFLLGSIFHISKSSFWVSGCFSLRASCPGLIMTLSFRISEPSCKCKRFPSALLPGRPQGAPVLTLRAPARPGQHFTLPRLALPLGPGSALCFLSDPQARHVPPASGPLYVPPVWELPPSLSSV